jgi:hypothetical protein
VMEGENERTEDLREDEMVDFEPEGPVREEDE